MNSSDILRWLYLIVGVLLAGKLGTWLLPLGEDSPFLYVLIFGLVVGGMGIGYSKMLKNPGRETGHLAGVIAIIIGVVLLGVVFLSMNSIYPCPDGKPWFYSVKDSSRQAMDGSSNERVMSIDLKDSTAYQFFPILSEVSQKHVCLCEEMDASIDEYRAIDVPYQQILKEVASKLSWSYRIEESAIHVCPIPASDKDQSSDSSV